jgi:hypothetical protein
MPGLRGKTMTRNPAMNATLTMQLLTSSPLTTAEEATALLHILCDQYPEFSPFRWNFFEPVNRPFTQEARKAIVSEWNNPFLFRRADLELSGEVTQRSQRSARHASIAIDIANPPEDQERLLEFFYALCRQFKPVIAFVHPLGEAEHADASACGMSYVHRKRVFPPRLTTEKLQRGLPTLFWLTVLGPPYVKLLGEARVSEAPVVSLEYLDADSLALQLTPSWTDFVTQYPLSDAIREGIKHYLGTTLFAAEPAAGLRRVPDFRDVDSRIRATMRRSTILRKTQVKRRITH